MKKFRMGLGWLTGLEHGLVGLGMGLEHGLSGPGMGLGFCVQMSLG